MYTVIRLLYVMLVVYCMCIITLQVMHCSISLYVIYCKLVVVS